MPEHRIDDAEFPILRGIVPPWRSTVEVIERMGTNDLLRRKTGFQSDEFTLMSIEDLENYAAAQVRVGEHIDKIEAGGLVLVKDDYDYFEDGLFVVVLDVTPNVEKQRVLIAGGNDDTWAFELRCNWRLRFVAAI